MRADVLTIYDGASPRETLEVSVKRAYAGGRWNGAGISSATAGSTFGPAHKTTLGIVEASDLSPVLSIFMGQSIDDTSVLIRYVYAGDANIDGIVDNQDFIKLGANFGGSSNRWALADFDYNSLVDSNDFNLLASNFGQALASSAAMAMPEPGAVGLLALLGLTIPTRQLPAARSAG